MYQVGDNYLQKQNLSNLKADHFPGASVRTTNIWLDLLMVFIRRVSLGVYSYKVREYILGEKEISLDFFF